MNKGTALKFCIVFYGYLFVIYTKGLLGTGDSSYHPSLISLAVSVDVKHHIYFLTKGAIDSNICFSFMLIKNVTATEKSI